MIALWDTTGTEVVKALSAERRSAGGVASGLALTLIICVDEKRVREAETAAATAAAAHPCRLLILVRNLSASGGPTSPESRLDAEIVVGGRLGPAEGVVMRMHGRLALHAESVIIPLLAPDVPVVTWWHGGAPQRISTDPIGVVADRRITDVAQNEDPITALRQRAEDFAPGDTDLAWTRSTPWRSLVASAMDTATATVVGASMRAPKHDPTAALLRGWLASRLQVAPAAVDTDTGWIDEVTLRLADGQDVTLVRQENMALLRRTGLDDRTLPLARRPLGEQLAEELRRLDPDQPYAAALSAATGVTGLSDRPSSRFHVWQEPTAA